MPDITKDAELLKNLGRLVESMPTIDSATGTTVSAFGDLAMIGAEKKPHEHFDFEKEMDPRIPFYLQGSTEFQEASAMEQRRRLKQAQKVNEAILQYWRGFPKLIIVDDDVITKDEYMQVMLLVFKVLRSEGFDKATASEQIEKDWIVDSRSRAYMNVTLFHDALFELVDVWTCDIEESTYVRFLDLLFKRIAVRAIVFFDGTVIKVTLEDKSKSIHELMAEAVPLATLSAFSHIARYMGDSSIATMGELAHAKPVDIERMRLEYIEKNHLSTEKFGSDLFQVLELMARISSGPSNSLHSLLDLTRADPELIDCMRQTFVSARKISTTKQTLMVRIVEELRKFGVGEKIISSETMAEDTYQNLFDLFIVKTGAEIATMAKKDLTRIKVQMERHGLYVPEDMLETKYKEFYETVINTTGDQVVQGAKQWIVENSNEESLSAFIEKDFNVFKEIDDAKPFTDDDAEFAALTSVQDDDHDGHDTGLAEAKPMPPSSDGEKHTKQPGTRGKPTKHEPKKKKKTPAPKPEARKSHATAPAPEPAPASKPETAAPMPQKPTKTKRDSKKEPQPLLPQEPPKPVAPPPEVEPPPSEVKPVALILENVEAVRVPTPEIVRDLEARRDDGGDVDAKPLSVEEVMEAPSVAAPTGDTAVVVPEPEKIKSVETVIMEESLVHDILALTKPVASVPTEGSPRRRTTIEWDVPKDSVAPPKEEKAKKRKYVLHMKQHNLVDRESQPPPPKLARIVVGGMTQESVPAVARYIHLLGFGEVVHAKTKEEVIALCEPTTGPGVVDLVCFVVGNLLATAVPMLRLLMNLVGPRVILVGGDGDEAKTDATIHECMAQGAVYFATMPVDYKELRSQMQLFLENSPQKYIFKRKQEKPASALFKALNRPSDAKPMAGATLTPMKPHESMKVDATGQPTSPVKQNSKRRSWFATDVRLPSLKDIAKKSFSKLSMKDKSFLSGGTTDARSTQRHDQQPPAADASPPKGSFLNLRIMKRAAPPPNAAHSPAKPPGPAHPPPRRFSAQPFS
ncbi:Aste57867_11325 [Aphanomyces stellatus]|uniref:Aste57867_11325 protein n=1 Tax=Aphanomyces stellatus TaxID=120398 RepID=A0A485KUI7_9STRA|nr:hypothetical protein As57867_011283 [Aphanomyces stellatus]VFT88187.1 Aste57867_11325 [Aphanomyces stellatus]